MDANDLELRLKRVFGDQAHIQLAENDLNSWMTAAQIEIASAASLLQVKAAASGTMPNMILPADMLDLHAVWWLDTTISPPQYKSLEFMSFQDAQMTANDVGQTGALVPYAYWIFGQTLTFVPYIPGATGTVQLFYTKKPTDITGSQRVFDIPIQYHERILEFCLKQAYEMDENYEASAFKTTEFKENLSDLVDQDAWAKHSTYPTISVRPEDEDWA